MPDYSRRRPITAPSPVHGSSEYSQSYIISTGHRPRPRNPIPTWTTRNRSNILPSEPDRRRPSTSTNQNNRRPRRRWVWQERAARSEIFENPRVPDANNNPTIPVLQNVPHRTRWPNHNASSDIFLFHLQNPSTIMAPPVRNQPKWPWQERSMQSKIFDQTEEQHQTPKGYEWDQRKSTPFFQEEDNKPSTSSTSAAAPPHHHQGKRVFPDKVKESNIFTCPAAVLPQGIKYPWDQRQSAFDAKNDTKQKFEVVSRYQQDFMKKKSDITHSIEAAGKKCYGTMSDQKKSNPFSDNKASEVVEVPSGHRMSRRSSGTQNTMVAPQDGSELFNGMAAMNLSTVKTEGDEKIANITVQNSYPKEDHSQMQQQGQQQAAEVVDLSND